MLTNRRARDVAIIALFSLIIFIEKAFIPPPYDKFFTILIESLLLCLGFIIVGFSGPIAIGLVSGLLASMRSGLAPFTITLALLYGLLISILSKVFRVKADFNVNKGRLAITAGIASIVVGLLGILITIMIGLPIPTIVIALIFIVGLIQGIIGGYLAATIWIKILAKVKI
ncbi:MAG: hypothetical protein QW803_02015 [Candidatus Methanomethylicia archaeon]